MTKFLRYELRKDWSLYRHLNSKVWPILPDILGKIHCQFNSPPPDLLSFPHKIPFFSRIGKLAQQNCVGKKEDKVGNKSRYRNVRKGKVWERERRIEIDSKKWKQVQILANAPAPKTERSLIECNSAGKLVKGIENPIFWPFLCWQGETWPKKDTELPATGLYFSKALLEGLIYGGAHLRRKICV